MQSSIFLVSMQMHNIIAKPKLKRKKKRQNFWYGLYP